MNRLEALNVLRDNISNKSVSLFETVLLEFIATHSTNFSDDDIIHLSSILLRIQSAEFELLESLQNFEDLNEKIISDVPKFQYPSLELSDDVFHIPSR